MLPERDFAGRDDAVAIGVGPRVRRLPVAADRVSLGDALGEVSVERTEPEEDGVDPGA